MRTRTAFVASVVAALMLFAAAPARADHFDGDASTGSFNPQLSVTLSPAIPRVNQTTSFTLRLTQQDHEDPPVFSRFRAPGDWGFAWSTRQAEKPPPGNIPTTDCDDAIDGLDDSPDGAGATNNGNRTNARIVRAEKIGTTSLKVVADGFGRGDPAGPIVFTGDAAFISFNPVTSTGQICLLLITHDTRVTNVPDPIPGDGEDTIEGVTEIVAQFPLALVNDGPTSYWETFADLTDLVDSSELQTINVSLLEFVLAVNGHSVGNWDAGGEDFSRASSISGPHNYVGRFVTCSASPGIGNCNSIRGPVVRTIPITITLPAPAITGPAGSGPFPANVTVTGTTVDPSTTVRLYTSNPAGPVAETTSNATGLWSMPVTLAHGSHNLTARVFDAGGESAASNVKSLVVDAVAPLAPVFSSPGAGATVPTGPLDITGTAEANSVVNVSEGVTPLGTVTASAGGFFTLNRTFNVKGSHTLTATATDGVGNLGPAGSVTFNVTTPPPVISFPGEGAFLNNASVTFMGTAENGSTVELSEGGVPFASVLAAGGTWSYGPVTLSEAFHAVTAIATGADTFVSLPTTRTFTIDLTAPGAPLITSPLDGSQISTQSVAIGGISEGFSTVQIIENGSVIGSGVANAGGSWTANIGFANGPHTILARALDRAGNMSPDSASVSFNVAALLVTITSPPENSFQPAAVTVGGTAEAGASIVRIFDGGIQVAQTAVDAGTWSKQITLASGIHRLTARGTNGTTVGPISNTRTITVDAAPPRLTIMKPSTYIFFQLTLLEPTVRGLAEDIHAFDSGVDHFELVYEDAFTGERIPEIGYRTGACLGCGTRDASFSDTPELGLGLWTLEVRAVDRVGNVSPPETIDLFSLGI